MKNIFSQEVIQMKKIIFAFVLLFSAQAFSLSLNLQGNCNGHLANGTPVAFGYYSNFNGCQKSAKAAISYQGERDNMITGTRSFTDKSDIYTFGKLRLIFKNSTGNTTGRYYYNDSRGSRKSVVLQCEVRDYEYGDCP